ncbi:MAG TPA: sugar transferase, partial [Thermoanaerobaculia bacterium]|nr:sugar transferase [Thermoanaerobaculia bacterium]
MTADQPQLRNYLRTPVRVAGDLGLAAAALAAAFLARIHIPLPGTIGLLPPGRIHFFLDYWWLFGAAQIVSLYFLGLYDPPERNDPGGTSRALALACTLQGLALTAFFFLAARTFPRSILLIYLPLDYLLLRAWKATTKSWFPVRSRRVALIGGGSAAREIAASIRGQEHAHFTLAGYVPNPAGTPSGDPIPDPQLGPNLGTIDDLLALVAGGKVDDIVLAAEEVSWRTSLLDRLARSGTGRGSVLLVPGPFESLIGRTRFRWVRDIPLIQVAGATEWRINRPVKRAFDLTLGGALFLLAIPLMLLCALAVRLSSRGPVLFRQVRVGRGRRFFVLLKFRTMRLGAEEVNEERLASIDDPRVTSIGSFLRRLRLDELPQLVHVLSGKMSLVGPRPERPGFVERYLREVPGYAERFAVA